MGPCTFCHEEFSKSSITRHLQSCKQQIALQAEAGSRQKAQKTRAFHLVVEGSRLPMYWMHLEIPAGTTLATLDRFLRDTWLECYGHLSAFTIGGVRYSVDAAIDEWDTGSKNMQVPLDQVLHPGQTCSYEYDFGSTTELTLQVISEREVLVLYSSKAVTKETMQMASCFGRPSPDPRFGSPIELRRGYLHRLFDLIGIGKTLSSKGIASEEAPPALLQIEPTSPFGNENMLETRMFGQPSACFQAVVTTEMSVMRKMSPFGLCASMSLSSSM